MLGSNIYCTVHVASEMSTLGQPRCHWNPIHYTLRPFFSQTSCNTYVTNLTDTTTIVLPTSLSNFRSIRRFERTTIRPRFVTGSGYRTPYPLVKTIYHVSSLEHRYYLLACLGVLTSVTVRYMYKVWCCIGIKVVQCAWYSRLCMQTLSIYLSTSTK